MSGSGPNIQPGAVAQDLSWEDRQDLLAFIDKRNWFEAKLESLKALAPVYPFMHPVLVPDPQSTAGYVRAGAGASQWRLPDKAQLAAWVNERVALEDEVERFDDGDMERMKQKTRQMTRVPLTQPSTDLVEVTLDLILLIDQLIQVLRQRGAVLEITSLRLQWDDLRYEVSREAESVKSEIDHVVCEAQAWTPGDAAPERRGSMTRHSGSALNSPTKNASLMDAASGWSSLSGQGTNSTSQAAPGSPTKSSPGSPHKGRAPNPALHMSILRSQLVGLQTRHRNFAFTLVKRSSSILDRMIDKAGKLKGLGGVDGPTSDDEVQRGAVPEPLLDLQEAIEATAKDIGARVTWCSEFEAQCRQALKHYQDSNHSKELAEETLSEIEDALEEPASSERHAQLAKLYAEATAKLPAAIDESFPRPSHPGYPAKDEHNAQIIEALETTYSEAKLRLDVAAKALSFYASLLKARESLQAQHGRVEALRHQLSEAVVSLEKGSAQAPRPSLDKVAHSGEHHSRWMQSVPEWLRNGDELVRSATDTQQSTTLAVMQYRKALLGAPMAVKPFCPSNGVPDDLGHVVDDSANDLITLARRCAELIHRTRLDAEALPLVVCLHQDTTEIATDAANLRRALVEAANDASWTSSRLPSALPTDLNRQLDKIADRADDAEGDLSTLKNLLGSSANIATPISNKVSKNYKLIDSARRELAIFARVAQQAETVRSIQTEVQQLLSSIDSAREGVSTSEHHAVSRQVAALKSKVADWNDNLVRRVTFVSDQPTPAFANGQFAGTAEPHSSDGPLTPPLTPTGMQSASENRSTLPDLEELDGRVRGEVNRQSARVSSALGHLISTAETNSFAAWAEPVTAATDSLTGAVTTLGNALAGLSAQLERARGAPEVAVLQLAQDAQCAGSTTLPEPLKNVRSLITRLNQALGAETGHIDMHRAADVFSNADGAREAALARESEAEQWHRDVDQLIADASARAQEARVAEAEAEATRALQIEAAAAKATVEARAKADVAAAQAGEAVKAAKTPAKAAPAAPQTPKAPPKTPSRKVNSDIKSLNAKLDALELENIVRPSPVVLKTTPKHRRLPTSDVAKKLASSFQSISSKTRTLAKNEPATPEVDRLLEKVRRHGALVPELDSLAVVSDAAAVCDKKLSNFLDAIDAGGGSKATELAERDAELAVEALKQATEPHLSDTRVASERKRITRAWKELRSLAEEEETTPSEAGSLAISLAGSLTPSLTSAHGSVAGSARGLEDTPLSKKTMRRVPSHKTLHGGMRVSSLPMEKATDKATEKPLEKVKSPAPQTPRARATSDKPAKVLTEGRPSRGRPSLDSMFTPPPPQRNRTRSSFAPATAGQAGKAFVPTVPQPFSFLTRSSSSSAIQELQTPTRPSTSTSRPMRPRLSAPPMTPSDKPERQLETEATPATRSRLDVAVQHVLTSLDVNVPIVPASSESTENWKDESGRYWIGTGSRARLCFCRILRSRTVMVRVGGGWVELSRYLLERFADALEPPMSPEMTAADRSRALTLSPEWRSVPQAITSATLAASTALSASRSSLASLAEGPMPPRTPRTPRASLPSFSAPPMPETADPSTPAAQRVVSLPLSASVISPEAASHASPGSPYSGSPGAGSPLVPVQFIRKASESPSMRDKERERIRSRPSLLRDNSAPA